jgi:hypothetical protein
MTVSLLMGWVLLALLVLLLIFLMVVTMISGRSGSPAAVVSSPGQEVPVNVFQRGAMAPVPVLSVAGPRSAAPQLATAGLSRWQPRLGAAPAPMGAPDPMGAAERALLPEPAQPHVGPITGLSLPDPWLASHDGQAVENPFALGGFLSGAPNR